MSSGVLERLQLQLRDATLGSPVASPIWPEFSPEKREKTSPTPWLLGAITLPSELWFTQTLYLWKVDFVSFLTISCMTHFEHQKASKISLENRLRKQYPRENREGFGGGATWQIRMPHGGEHAWRGLTTHHAAWGHARRAHSAYKRIPPPLHFRCYARAPRLSWA